MTEKPAGTDPITFTDPADVCAAITGAFVTGWKAEALRYLAWWAARASRSASPHASGRCGSCGATVALMLGDHHTEDGEAICLGSGCLPSAVSSPSGSAPGNDGKDGGAA